MPSPSDYYAPWVREEMNERVMAHYERRLAEDATTIADLRSRLALFEEHVCEECGCAAAVIETYCGEVESTDLCQDCMRLEVYGHEAGACISVGLRALCGRRILEGVE